MNFDHNIYWAIRNPPSSSSIYPIGQEQTDMQEIVPPFVLTLPLCLNDTVTRDFVGGTFLSFLQMIYEFYQEPVDSEELTRIMNLSAFNRNRMIALIERQEAGEVIRRIHAIGPASTYEGVRDNLLLVDPS